MAVTLQLIYTAAFVIATVIERGLAVSIRTCPPGRSNALLPYTGDCSKFYACNLGEAVILECTRGAHFSPKQKVCLPFDEAGCIEKTLPWREDTTEEPWMTTEEPWMTTEEPWMTTEEPWMTTEEPWMTTEEPWMTTEEPWMTTEEPWMTTEEPWWTTESPVETTEEPWMTTEEPWWPTTEEPWMTTEVSWWTTEDPPSTTTNSSEEICPPTGTDFLPYPDNCTLYYLCMSGEETLMSCPHGLHFSPTQKQCMNASDAGCWKMCPPTGTDLLPYPENCTLYYFCMSGEATLMSCPDGLHFSASQKECMDPSQAECSMMCPSNGSALIPHPNNCTLYFFCMSGEPTLMSCPDGMHFSPTQKVCMNTSAAGCQTKDTPAGNTLMPYPEDCAKFYHYISGNLNVLDCPAGQHFSRTELICLLPEVARCSTSKKENKWFYFF